ncbi:ABC-type transport auxiliary lipoprotein family protein [Falsihalocynthiibacter sp. BN13B15]|uniref:ABC-type transport auxiliary lipoprotein family protein n=1 Tax=Falsihalocynthiibacter sp. BN13B15 TaxID=3240871 RepID=UPI00350F8FA7
MIHRSNPFVMIRSLVLLTVVSGCSALTALNDVSTPLDVYELRAPVDIQATTRRQLPRDVIIELPATSGALATDRIMIRPNALQAQYLPEVRWSDATPVMVQTLMLRSVEATGAVRYVGRQPLASHGDFAVVTELVDFQAELNADTQTATVQLKLIVRVIRESDAKIVASKTFRASAPSASTETQILVEAFNAASTVLFSEFAGWLPSVLSS